jgi:hypothetical protein
MKQETFEEFLEREGYPEGRTQEIWEDGARKGAEWQREQFKIKTMKANEMRIGNVVNIVNTTRDFLGRVWYSDALISHEDIYDIARGNDYQYNPIPLTEEWLLKFGFKYDTDNDKLCKSLHIDILSFRASEGHMCLESQGYRTLYKHIKYVHQLQNLYFALTGEELEILNIKTKN